MSFSTVAALLPEEAGRDRAGAEVSKGVRSEPAAAAAVVVVDVAAGAAEWGEREGEGEGEGVWRRRKEPTMERGICVKKEVAWLPGGVGVEASSWAWSCLRAASAGNNMSNMVHRSHSNTAGCGQEKVVMLYTRAGQQRAKGARGRGRGQKRA